MNKKVLHISITPYVIYFILFLVERVRKWSEITFLTNRYFVVMAVCYVLCGILICNFVHDIQKCGNRNHTTIIMGVHIMIYIAVWLLLRAGMINIPPIHHFLEVSFLLIGIYIYQIIRTHYSSII